MVVAVEFGSKAVDPSVEFYVPPFVAPVFGSSPRLPTTFSLDDDPSGFGFDDNPDRLVGDR